jgi:pimeloyl-ACP methyl ester carboxylesterase
MIPTAGYAPVEGGRLYFERAGEGSPVVLIHPDLWDCRIWDDQFEVFADQHDVVRYDLRGYGLSDRPSGPHSDVRDLLDVLAFLGIERVALVGCSSGATLAIDFALAYPDQVDALILTAPGLTGYDWPGGGIEELGAAERELVVAGDLEGAMDLALAVWTPMRTDPAADERIRRIAMENAHTFALDDSIAEPPPPAVDRLGDVQAATLIIVGDRDVEEVHALADLLAERIPGATKRVVAGADHLVNVRKASRFNRLALDFLALRM